MCSAVKGPRPQSGGQGAVSAVLLRLHLPYSKTLSALFTAGVAFRIQDASWTPETDHRCDSFHVSPHHPGGGDPETAVKYVSYSQLIFSDFELMCIYEASAVLWNREIKCHKDFQQFYTKLVL